MTESRAQVTAREALEIIVCLWGMRAQPLNERLGALVLGSFYVEVTTSERFKLEKERVTLSFLRACVFSGEHERDQ